MTTEDSIFDDPFVIATVNAQTRAMNKFDQHVLLDHRTTRRLYRDVARRYGKGADMVQIIEYVLDLNEPFTNEAERGGYKIAIGMAFYEVQRKRGLEFAELERSRPFAPR